MVRGEDRPLDGPLAKAQSELDSGNLAQARGTLRAFIDDNPSSAEGWTMLGRVYLAMGKGGKALRRFNKALKVDSHYAPAFVGRGEVFEKKGRLDEAANEYRAASLADPKGPLAEAALARISERNPSAE